MSGELRATAEWAPTDPVAEQERRRHARNKPSRRTTRGWRIFYRLRRLVVVLAVVLGGVALAAWLIAWLSGREFQHVLTLAYYFTGAGLGALAFLGGQGPRWSWNWQPEELEPATTWAFELGFLALVCFGCGVLLEIVL